MILKRKSGYKARDKTEKKRQKNRIDNIWKWNKDGNREWSEKKNKKLEN